MSLPSRPSKSFIEANPHLYGAQIVSDKSGLILPAANPKPKRTYGAPKLNGTEQRWQDAHPEHVPFPLRLRWGGTMHYSPDFMERREPQFHPTLIEVKGGHIHDRDIVRFKGCADEWKWLFVFEMWQWQHQTWTLLYRI